MKTTARKWTGFLMVLLAALPITAATKSASLTEDERQRLADHVARTEKLFLGSVAGLSAEQLAFKPAPEKWSIAEVAEHLAVAEKFIRETTVETLKTAATAEQLEQGCVKEDQIEPLMLDRSQKFQAPEPVMPQSRWSSVAETLAAFRQERAATVKLVAEDVDLRAHCSEHPGFGNLDAYGWLYFLSSHTERHTLQIEEIKADPGFPRG